MKLTGTFGDLKEKSSHNNPEEFFLSKVKNEKKEKNRFALPRASEPFLSSHFNNYPVHISSQLEFPVKPLQANLPPDLVSPKFSQKTETGALLNNLIMNLGSSGKKKSPKVQKSSSTDKTRRVYGSGSVMTLNLEENQSASRKSARARSGSHYSSDM